MRVIRRFIGHDVSAQIFLRRNAGVVQGKRFSARARFTLARAKFSGFCTDAQLNGAVRKLIAKFASQARNRKRRRVEAVRRINKFGNQNRDPSEPAVGTDTNELLVEIRGRLAIGFTLTEPLRDRLQRLVSQPL